MSSDDSLTGIRRRAVESMLAFQGESSSTEPRSAAAGGAGELKARRRLTVLAVLMLAFVPWHLWGAWRLLRRPLAVLEGGRWQRRLAGGL